MNAQSRRKVVESVLASAKIALQTGTLLHLTYDGFSRDVEVHAIGTTKQDNLAIRVYQVRGDSATENVGWKLLKLDECHGASITHEQSLAPREGYAMNDRGMVQVIAQLESKT